jgi:hypothetical protein
VLLGQLVSPDDDRVELRDLIILGKGLTLEETSQVLRVAATTLTVGMALSVVSDHDSLDLYQRGVADINGN